MTDELSQLAESRLNRILIVGSVINYRRKLAMALIKLLPKPTFSALDPGEHGLLNETYDWSTVDLMIVDMSEYKSQIRTWYFGLSSVANLPPVIFLDNRATVDDAGDMVRAGAVDYIDITHMNTRRLSRALLFAASSKDITAKHAGESQTPVSENLEATQVLPTVKAEPPSKVEPPSKAEPPSFTDNFPVIKPYTDEPTEVLPVLTPAILAAMEEEKEPVEEHASFLTTGLMDILDRQQLEKTATGQTGTVSEAPFLTTGIMAILERESVAGNALPKGGVVQTTSLSIGKNWPFSQQQLDQGEAIIGEYQVLEFIAVGGTASVFKARHQQDSNVVAIKLFDNDMGDENGQERFSRGYRLIKSVSHPNIVSIKELVVSDGYAFVVMEYISGGDLKLHLENGISRRNAVRYTAEIAAALDAAHQQKILHCDLKPSNVLLREDGSLALLDFGIAKLMAESTSHLTQSDHVVGTSHYISPELAAGGELDARSDLYALGVMLYEMLEGRRPYIGGSPVEIMEQHIRAPVPELSSTADPLNPIVRRLMAKAPNDRYGSGAEVISALTNAIPDLMGDNLLKKVN